VKDYIKGDGRIKTGVKSIGQVDEGSTTKGNYCEVKSENNPNQEFIISHFMLFNNVENNL
jgi:hypothetical protein